LSHDRTLVPQSYLQDIYAEMLVALGDLIEPGDLGDAHIRMAMEDDRVDPDTCVRLFKQQFGKDAVITNPFDADSNQEAARAGASLVSPRTFGASINAKLRGGGVQTTTEQFCRNKDILEGANKLGLPGGYKEITRADPLRDNLREYVQMLSQQFYTRKLEVNFAQWTGTNTVAIYTHGLGITFNVMRMTRARMQQPVSKCTATCLHELAHCMGNGHDGVYDQEFERLINHHTRLLSKQPELYEKYEPE
ncbi:unnamed protein product, partial [marine sediment metagenome]